MKERNVLFNDTLNTLFTVIWRQRGNPQLPHGLLFPISNNGSFMCIIPDRTTHTTAFVTPVVEHRLEQEIAQWAHHEGLINAY